MGSRGAARSPTSSSSSRRAPSSRRLTGVELARRELPDLAFDRVAVLAHQHHPAVVVHGQRGHRARVPNDLADAAHAAGLLDLVDVEGDDPPLEHAAVGDRASPGPGPSGDMIAMILADPGLGMPLSRRQRRSGGAPGRPSMSGGKRRLEGEALAGPGMDEGEARGVEGRPAEAQQGLRGPPPVGRTACGFLRRSRRPRPDGRSTRGGRGSGGCARCGCARGGGRRRRRLATTR